MSGTQRKATDVLLELESKIDNLLHIVRSQDLNIKILQNKLNALQESINSSNKVPEEMSVSTVTKDLSNDFTITVEEKPTGFSRASRPETFSKVKPLQAPQVEAEIKVNIPEKPTKQENPKPVINKQNSVPVIQRVTNSKGKSLFLADVEVIDLGTLQSVVKTRTNGSGKWMASLPVGQYRVKISRFDNQSKERIESSQEIIVDGISSPLELNTIIIKAN